MSIPETPYTRIAYDTIRSFLETGKIPHELSGVPARLFEMKRGCFVSIHLDAGNELRGCMGTLEPQEKNLVEEIRRNALSAAFHDHRFPPLELTELPGINLSVDVLTPPEKIHSYDDLDPAIFGLIIKDKHGHRGVLLPSIPGVETVEKQVQIVKRKAGILREEDLGLEFYRFTSTRYH